MSTTTLETSDGPARLTRPKVEKAIEEAIGSDGQLSSKLKELGLTLSLARDAKDWERIERYASIKVVDSHITGAMMTPWYFGLTILGNDNEVCGILTVYVAFSSWNGRIFYVDRLECDSMDESTEQLLMRVIAKIAADFKFARLTWRHKETPQWHSQGTNQPEMQGEILTLCLDKTGIENFIQSAMPGATQADKEVMPFTNDAVRRTMNDVLDQVHWMKTGFSFRLATATDIPTMAGLIQGLADYVKEPDSIMIMAADYQEDGFNNQDPLFYCLIADRLYENGEMHSCGFALFFFGYELGKGRFLYLEDLFFEPQYRGNGGGKRMMQLLAHFCQSLNCGHLYWQALDWNMAGLKFYEGIGAKVLDGVKTSRYCDRALTEFANGELDGLMNPT